MQRILRTLLCLMALVAVAGLAACGGEGASESTDVNKLLQDTFSGEKKVESGKFELSLGVDGASQGQLQGQVRVKLGGPFESQGEGKMPKFDFEASVEGAGQSLRAGVMTTGEKGFVSFNGADYAVSDEVFKQFVTSYEKASKEGDKDNQSLQSLGMDPRKWLTGARNAGEAKVGDTETIEITGTVDVGKLLDDMNAALQRAGSLGLQGQAQLPTKLTDKQKAEVQQAIKRPKVSIFTGKDDAILRRMRIDFQVAQDGGSNAGVEFDITLTDVGEDQEFKAPENPRPFEELMQSLGALGLGGLGGGLGGDSGTDGSGDSGSGGSGSGGSDSGESGSGGSGSGGSGSSGSEPDGAGSSTNLRDYTACVEKAGNDLQKAQECAELLTR